MTGFGTELLLFCGLGYVVLGPKRMHALVQQLAKMKAAFDQSRRELELQLTTDRESDIKDPSS